MALEKFIRKRVESEKRSMRAWTPSACLFKNKKGFKYQRGSESLSHSFFCCTFITECDYLSYYGEEI